MWFRWFWFVSLTAFIWTSSNVLADDADAMCSADGPCAASKDEIAPLSLQPEEEEERVVNRTASNPIWSERRTMILRALADHKDCGDECYGDLMDKDFEPFKQAGGIQQSLFNEARAIKFMVHYQIIKGRLYRSECSLFPLRCEGIEHFLLKMLKNRPNFPDMEFVVNTRDNPLSPHHSSSSPLLPIMSFSKDHHYSDIMYPAWAFWAGGPCIRIEPKCIGRWDLKREAIMKKHIDWTEKKPVAFFRGGRTSTERDPLIRLSVSKPDLVEARYVRGQMKDPNTMGMEPAPEMPMEEHCVYKYLFNFRGVAASFRHRHLFMCNSLVLHVGEEWKEFYYDLMKPWVHYVPIKTDLSDVEDTISFLKDNDDLAERISQNGFDFAFKHLRMQDVTNYWYGILRRYATLQKWKVEKDPATSEVVEKRR
eukprot:TRINITY_DN11684_c0_g1_i1.p1 TRINITY_DN11684_c0_g1~~TRINITY_DN11684_c0_g1_i1.p1  ORF type:complete len:423 (+),score=97.60 TRINITY_DN11684_c0_g1_i1:80-1348(+)